MTCTKKNYYLRLRHLSIHQHIMVRYTRYSIPPPLKHTPPTAPWWYSHLKTASFIEQFSVMIAYFFVMIEYFFCYVWIFFVMIEYFFVMMEEFSVMIEYLNIWKCCCLVIKLLLRSCPSLALLSPCCRSLVKKMQFHLFQNQVLSTSSNSLQL